MQHVIMKIVLKCHRIFLSLIHEDLVWPIRILINEVQQT